MYDFDKVVDRLGTGSQKWTFPHDALPEYVTEPPLPMWVADMDFLSPPAVIEALESVVKRGIFGYTRVEKGVVDTIIEWQKKRHNFDVNPSWLLQSSGVVAGLAMIIDVFTNPGDSILIQSPVYGPFHNVPREHKREVISVPLVDEGNTYRFDEKAFEAAIKPTTKLFIMSNPHNPTGNVWTKDELTKMGEICLRHNIMVVADDIHQDLVWNKNATYIPFASLSKEFAENSITLTAPSKTFNIAGLQTSNIFVPNEAIRKRLYQGFCRFDSAKPNMLGLVACKAAYMHGEPWLDELLAYLQKNYEYIEKRTAAMPGVKLYMSNALYLGWLDFKGTGLVGEDVHKHLLTKAGVWLDAGLKFGKEGSGFARINYGCPKSTLVKALDLIEGSFK